MLYELDEVIRAIGSCRAGGIEAIEAAGGQRDPDDYTYALLMAVDAVRERARRARCVDCRWSFLGRQAGKETLRCKTLKRAVDERWCCGWYEHWKMAEANKEQMLFD